MDYQGLKDLKLIVKYLKNYNEMIVNLFIHKVDNKSFSVLDFGAGIGTLAEIFYKIAQGHWTEIKLYSITIY